jgi:hypothetical protein
MVEETQLRHGWYRELIEREDGMALQAISCKKALGNGKPRVHFYHFFKMSYWWFVCWPVRLTLTIIVEEN